VDGVDAVVFTHGAPYGSSELEAVDYGGVRNILTALDGRRVRIALMTAIGVTIDGVRDQQNLPLDAEPESVVADLHDLANRT
jgi:hypothetical protein